MNLFKAVFIAVIVSSTPVLGQGVGERTGINAMLGAAPSTADFVRMAAISDMFEIESSKIAASKADGAGKQFAQKMIEDHTKTSTELKSLASKMGNDLPSAMDSSHQSKIDKLKGLQGAELSKEYRAMQIEAHENAVSLFERYAKGGDNEQLKAFASKHLPHLQQHLKMAQELSER